MDMSCPWFGGAVGRQRSKNYLVSNVKAYCVVWEPPYTDSQKHMLSDWWFGIMSFLLKSNDVDPLEDGK